MIKYLIGISMIGLCFFGFTANASSDFPYDEYWEKVESFLSQQKPQSALNLVVEIYDQAKKDDEEPHLLRSIITKNRIAVMIEEVEMADIIQRMESDIESASNRQVEACLQSATASMYLQYLRSNYYRLSDRITLGTLAEDQSLWSIPDIEARADALMIAALDLSDVKNRKLEAYDLVEDKLLNDISLHPYLLQQGIYFFQDDISYMSSVVDDSTIDQEIALAPINDFIDHDLDAILVKSRRKDNVFVLYHQVLKYYEREPAIQSKLDIQRLQYARQKFLAGAALESESNLYINSLQQAFASAKHPDQKALYGFYLAQSYKEIGSRYGNVFDPAYRDYLRQSYDLLSGLSPNDKNLKNTIKNELVEIKAADLTMRVDEVVIPGVPFPVKVDFKNVSTMHFKLNKLTTEEFIRYHSTYNQEIDKTPIFKKKSEKEWSIDLDLAQDYQRHSTEVIIDGLRPGQYALFIGESDKFQPETGQTVRYAIFQVSNQQIKNWSTAEGNILQLKNRTTGEVLSQVYTEITEFDDRRQGTSKSSTSKSTDKDGKIVLKTEKNRRNNMLLISTIGKDKLITQYYPNRWYDNQQARRKAYTFMDRSIYRPGQTAKGKILLLEENQNAQPRIQPNTSVQIVFKDVNYQVVSTQNVAINDYGAGEFSIIIPDSGLKGRYTLEISDKESRLASTQLLVEEYRRPTIEGDFDLSSDYRRLGDAISVSGSVQSMSGFPSQGAKVQYTVSEQAYIVWRSCGWSSRWYPPYNSTPKIIDSGQTVTDDGGTFEIEVETDVENMKTYQEGKTYTLTLDVTDQGGETITLNKTIHLTPKTYRIKHNIPQVLSEDTDYTALTVTGVNYDSNPVEVTSKIEIKKYAIESDYRRSRNYTLDHLLYTDSEFRGYETFYTPSSIEESFDSRFETLIIDINDLEKTIKELSSGEYQLKIITEHGEETISQDHRCLVTGDDRVSPRKLLYTETSQESSTVGATYMPSLYLHPEVKHIYYYKARRNTIIEEGWLTRRDFLKQRFNISSVDQGGFTLHYSTVLNGDVDNVRINVDVPYTDTYASLDLKIDSLLMPATLYHLETVTTVDGQPLSDGNMTLVMYDAALDAIYPHQWKKSFYPTFHSHLHFNDLGMHQAHVKYIGRYQRSQRNNAYIQLDVIPRSDWYGITHLQNSKGAFLERRSSGHRMSKSMGAPAPAMALEVSEDVEVDMMDSDTAANGFTGSGDDNATVDSQVIPRSDFGETLFFVTDGQTDSLGKYDLPFKTNDALTKWKVLAFVHDKEMRYGFAEKVIRTQKDIQIIQTPTRLLYEGDEIAWPITVQNSTESNVSGTASIFVKSYLTQEVITDQFIEDGAEVAISVDGNSSQTHTFNIVVPANFKDQIEIVTTFKSSVGSDAEARVVPVLTTQQFLTAGDPLWVEPNSIEELLLNPSTDQELTTLRIELTSNPFWLVARSFPMLSDRNLKVSTNVSENLYIASVANQIVSDYPAVERAFTSTAITSETSGLNRNDDVKIQELNATSWVRQAARAETRTADFAKYFNATESTESIKQLKKKLKTFQNPDGGYSWIQGGRSSVHTTLRVLLDLARLYDMGISDQIITDRGMTQNALNYIDQEIRKYLKNSSWSGDNINYMMLQHLYLYAILGDQYQSPSYQKKWLATLENKWTDLGINEQAIAGLIFLKEDKTDSVGAIKVSLEERGITREDGTIFWRGINEYYAYANAYGTQALVIAFMKAADADSSLIDSATQWILANKRSNEWYNDRATADVVQMLYNVYGGGMYDDPDISVSLNGSTLEMEQSLTYQTIDLNPADYNGQLNLSVNNGTNYPIFGGVYRQFFQPLSAVEQHKAGGNLSIKKSIFVKSLDDNKATYLPVSTSKVTIGDELTIRLEIEAFDRMNYVYVSDVRPANTEPVDRKSGHDYRNGLYLYQSPSDSGQEFFIQTLSKGVHTLEYTVKVLQSGTLSSGLAEVQSFYVPEFSAYDAAGKLISVPLSVK